MPDRLPPGARSSTSVVDQAEALLYAPDGRPLPRTLRPPDEERRWGAGEPFPAEFPRGRQPRVTRVPSGQNQRLGTRDWPGVALTPWEQLQAFSDWDWVRLAIEDLKRGVVGMRWTVGVRDEFADGDQRLAARQHQKDISAVKRFMETPDPLKQLDWEEWANAAAEQVIALDCLTLMPRETVGGRPLGLELIDGTTIKPLVDDLGRPPLPGAPQDVAYQQIIDGAVETEYAFGDIWYKPMNRRVHTPFGFPGIEQVLFMANLAMRQIDFELEWFESGNVPDALFSVDDANKMWTADALERYNEYFNEGHSGRADERSGKVRFGPPGTLHLFKGRDLQIDQWELLIRGFCWAYNVSPLPMIRAMNRATAVEHTDTSRDMGPVPVFNHLLRQVNRFIRFHLGFQHIEVRCALEEIEEARLTLEREKFDLEHGIVTIDVLRERRGEPLLGGKASEPHVWVGGVPKPVEEMGEVADNVVPFPGARVPDDDEEDEDERPDDEDRGKDEEDEKDSGRRDQREERGREREPDKAAKADLRKWRDVALRSAKRGQAQRVFRSAHIPPTVQANLAARLMNAETVDDVKQAFAAVSADNAAELEGKLAGALEDFFSEHLDEWVEFAQRVRAELDPGGAA